MGVLEILLISISLAMDAFAVAVCKGLSMRKLEWKKAVIIALYFAIFQALMPTLGFFLGITFKDVVIQIDHWLAFILLVGIGLNMLKEAFSKENESFDDNVGFKTMAVLGLATSIDALAIGITFAFLRVNLLVSVLIIGVVTFMLSLVGVVIGNRFGNKYEKKAEIFGGVILILLGAKILLEHLGVF